MISIHRMNHIVYNPHKVWNDTIKDETRRKNEGKYVIEYLNDIVQLITPYIIRMSILTTHVLDIKEMK